MARSVRFRLGLMLISALFVSSLAFPLAAFAADSATVSEELNLRDGPGRNYTIVLVMPSGASIAVTGSPTEGWYPVNYQGTHGWAYGQYLVLNNTVAASSGTARGAATVVTNLLNMRSGPGLGYQVLAQLTYGTTVDVMSEPQVGGGLTWVEVRANLGRGWVASQYLDPGEGGSAGPVSPPPAPESSTPPAPSTGNSIIEIITAAAVRYDQPANELIAVAKCESNLDPNAYNPRSGASGLFQFLPGTWRSTPFAGYSIFDPWANANAAAWMWSVGRRGEWVC